MAKIVARIELAPLAKQSASELALAELRQNFSIELAPFPEGDKALDFQRMAAGISVSDKESHKVGLEETRRGKALKRGIEEHWARVLRWLEDRKKDIRGIRDADMALVEPGLAHLNREVLAYEDVEKLRIEAEEARQRAEQERIAREKRQAELDALERQALEAEAESDALSDRERAFVQRVYAALGVDRASERWLNAAAKSCGFTQDNYGVRLMAREKIRSTLEAMQAAVALREQAAAVAEKPVQVQKVQVESQMAKVSGVRTVTTWTGEVTDRDMLIDAVMRGVADRKLLMPNQPAINELARALHAQLDRIPGLRHVKTVTKAG